jgi:prepilin-type N-terminal cleavage/methylation domain-containing protein
MIFKKSHGFTLLEILIVIALIVILATTVLIFLNPWNQIAKGQDAIRKNDLAKLQRAFEDYYNDKGCYPPPTAVCYDTPTDVKKGTFGTQPTVGQKCHICGREESSPSFSPYLNPLPCDPQHPTKDYLYSYDCEEGDCPPSCISAFKIYSDFSFEGDNDSSDLGCRMGGCGPAPIYGYDYGISSSNTDLSRSNVYNCISPDNKCNVCNTYEQCINPRSGCKQPYVIYGSTSLCCTSNPHSYCP